MSTAQVDRGIGVTSETWREVLAETYNHDDASWRVGDGGSWLIGVLYELMHPREADDAPPAVTESQLRYALDTLAAS